MPIPDYQSLMLPLLRRFTDGTPRRVRDLVDGLGDEFHLTSEERAQLLPSGRQETFRNRIAWARTYLYKAGLLEQVARGEYKLTSRGQEVLAAGPKRIDIRFLSKYPEFREFRERKVPQPSNGSSSNDSDGETPRESIDRNYAFLRRELAQELLDETKRRNPVFFERLVIDLLVAMGYGGSWEDAERAVGRSGDGGIDGIIKEDRLGLDAIYIQAKRWDNVVGSQTVQAFAGSLEGQRARKGVMITTSRFSRSAYDYGDRIGNRIVLIDGDRLANLMIDHGVGVTPEQSIIIHRIDLDYFDEE